MILYQSDCPLYSSDAIHQSENKNPKLFNRLNDIKDGSVLDVGFRYPIMFYALYHMFKFKKFEGVDRSAKNECLSKAKEYEAKDEIINQKIKEANSFFDIYDALVAPELNQLPKLGEEDFNNLFYKNLHFETEIQGFLKNYENQKYDFINLSNVLHLLKGDIIDIYEVDIVVSKCLNMLNPLGIMYIRTQTTRFSYPPESEMADYLVNKFPSHDIIIQGTPNDKKCVELWYYK